MRYLEIFKRQFLLARVGGVPVMIDYRWFFVLAFMTWLTANSIFAVVKDVFISILLGLIAAFLFFGSILLHEIAHAVVAKWENIGVKEIVLHPFGGMARMRREPDTPRAEFRIAAAGPAASFLLAIAALIPLAISNSLGTNALSNIFYLLFFGNLMLAIFNLFPGYPLDGGRVLRAFLWRRGKDLNEATALTGHFGQMIAAVLIVFGFVAALVWSDFLTGLWTILVGFFLFDAATGIVRQINRQENLIVEQVMRLTVSVEPEITVQQFVDRILTVHRREIFTVAKDRQLYGILTLADLKKLPREDWQKTLVRNAMRPITPNLFVESHTPLPEARILMNENGIGALGVIDEKGNLVGFLNSGRKETGRREKGRQGEEEKRR